MRRTLERLSITDVIMYLVGGLLIVSIVAGSVKTIISGTYDAEQWFEFLVSGVALGGIYALIALGYTMVYGILRMINFAHSEVFMSGPLTAYFLAEYLGKSGFLDTNPVIGLLAIFILAMAVSVLVAVLVERIAYRPLRYAPRLVPLITAIGASLFLQYFFRGLYGANIKVYPEIPALDGKVTLGNFTISYVQILVVVAAALMMVGLQLFIQRTRTGKALRAVAEDKHTAALLGVDVDRMIVLTFVIGGALAGAAGVLFALMFKQVNFLMGFIPGIKAFTAAVLGGIGSIPGAMLGGFFLGLAESVGPSLILDGVGIPAAYQLKDATAFTLLVLVLIFRPSGILGDTLPQKKA